MFFKTFFLENLPPSHSSDRHAHDFCEIVLAEDSGGYIEFEGRQEAYNPGDILVHPSGTRHLAYNKKSGKHYCVGVTGWETDHLKEGIFRGNDDLRKLFYDIQGELSQKKQFYKSVIELKVHEIVIKVNRMQAGSQNAADSPECASGAKKIMDEHFDRKIDLTVLSSELLISKDAIRHEFKKEYGISPIQYLINTRIENAKKLLDTTEMKVKDIALKCGFENEYYFSRIFKKLEKTSPSSYRAKNIRIQSRQAKLIHKKTRL